MRRYRVKFLPVDRIIEINEGETILDAAMRAGVHVNASCGGNGSCGKCRVIVPGDIGQPGPQRTISSDDYERGVRLACTTAVRADVEVEVPLESQVDPAALKRRREAPRILSPVETEKLVKRRKADPPVIKRYVTLSKPTAADNASDFTRLARELGEGDDSGKFSIDLKVLRHLGKVLREADWKVTATVAGMGRNRAIVNVEPEDRTKTSCSITLDIGTTTVCGHLLGPGKDNTHYRVIAESSDYNGQISFGEDVISRILFSRKTGGLHKLQGAVVSTINKVIAELLQASGVKKEDISHVAVAGNTTMSHLLLGIDPTHIMFAPYTPVTTFYPPIRLADLGIGLGDHTYAYLFPSPASYVGGDIVAGVLGSGMCEREETTLFMDIGTNGEIVLGNKDWLTCASCSAGPAFEGGGIEFGMRAGTGAIEQVRINPLTFEPMLLTIGKAKPLGICGSGLIDLVAGLLETGLIDRRGKFTMIEGSKRVRLGRSGFEYLICHAADTGIGRDMVITEVDLDNLIRTKGAVYAGCKVLLSGVGLGFHEIDRVIVAGGFGHYIDLEKAIAIGLLPELPPEKFIFIGNGALLGAGLINFSKGFLREAGRIARMMTNIELSTNPAFMDEFVAAMFLPHTDGKAFPGVTERLGLLQGGGETNDMYRE
ncbi:MAG TPA: ASKHA domain-containing protein [Syntrophorhabdaceae bacterium]|jgi:uncharacterized 2Fe-2S/4Fe-4S cluster protein (DUF4445 family)